MARKRAAERDLQIPLPANVERRLECLANPELFLTTYFPETFFQGFTSDRRAMLQSIVDAAVYGGDFALAGPRGEGKTRLAMYGALYLMIAGLSPFPIVIGKSQTKAANELKTIKERLQQSELLIQDFPEIGVPFKAVGGWSSRARMQTVNGVHTNIEIAADHIIFPTIGIDDLPADWPADCEPCSAGQIMSSLGVDGPIRGTNYRDHRPSLAILDDIEDKKTASSDLSIEKNEEIIEKDVGGLGASGRRVSRVMLCTTQNRKCNAYKYTDPAQKPSWKGRRFRKMITPPSRMDMWQTYMEMRIERDKENDPDAREAHRYYRDNREAMDEGCEISNPYSYDTRLAKDGETIELSSIQAYYNRMADFGKQAVQTEDDNDPPPETGPVGNGLTWELVSSRLSGLSRQQLPANACALTAAIDLGKYRCHWVVTAWWKGAGGCVVDYGIAEVHGTDTNLDTDASEPHIYKTLLQWRDELLDKKFVDATGTERGVDFCFVDSGNFTNAAYEFERQVRGIFHCCKGTSPYRPQKASSEKLLAGSNMHAHFLDSQKVWLYNLDTDYWKKWVHERFLTPTFDDENMLRRGALSIYSPEGNRKHTSYAHHIVAEELVSEFKEGKGSKTYWHVHNANNHWLDATYMAAAATEVLDIRLLQSTSANPDGPSVSPRSVSGDKKPKPKPKNAKPHGRYRSRPGGWVKGVRR
jgi:hypothetical protein